MTESSMTNTKTFACALLAVLALFGCENSIEPYSRRAEPYSVYGALSLDSRDQFVRVKPLQTPFQLTRPDPLAATVTLRNLSDGGTHTLQDSVFLYDGGTVTHNFWTPLDVQPQTAYELTVERPDGAKTRGRTLTPTDTKALIDPHKHTPGPPTDTSALGSGNLDCLSRFEVTFREAKIPFKASIGVHYKGQPIWVPYDAAIEEGADGESGISFTPNRVLTQLDGGRFDDPLTCLYFENRCQYLDTGRIEVAYAYLGPNWFGNRPPDDDDGFDPATAGQLEGGLGFFGSVERDTVAVTIHRGVVELPPEACRLP